MCQTGSRHIQNCQLVMYNKLKHSSTGVWTVTQTNISDRSEKGLASESARPKHTVLLPVPWTAAPLHATLYCGTACSMHCTSGNAHTGVLHACQ